MFASLSQLALKSFVHPFAKRLERTLEHHSKNLRFIQDRALERCLQQIDGSDYAMSIGLKKKLNRLDFQKQVPIVDYSDLEPFIHRVMDGDITALFRKNIHLELFGLTSGTTGNRKHIPLSGEQAQSHRKNWYRWGVAFYRAYPQLLPYPVAHFSSAWGTEQSPSGVVIADMSAYFARSQPWYVKSFFHIPEFVSSIEEQRAKYYTYLLYLLPKTDVGFISTATPATLLSVAELGLQWRENLLRDLYDGTHHYAAQLGEAVRRSVISKRPKIDKSRLRYLENLAPDEFLPRNFWPKLQTLATWTGGTMSHYRQRLCSAYGVSSLRDLGYIASEGYMFVPLMDDSGLGVPAIEDYVFEFEDSGGNVHLMEGLEVGCEYKLIMTSLSGLIRYRMNDIVSCVGKYNELPLMKFLTKQSFVVDLSGEKLSAFHAVQAIETLQSQFNVDVQKLAIMPMKDRYLLAIEDSLNADTQMLAHTLDRALCGANFIYEEHRQVDKLKMAEVLKIEPGTFAHLRSERIAKSRASVEQYKDRSLLTNAEEIAFVLARSRKV